MSKNDFIKAMDLINKNKSNCLIRLGALDSDIKKAEYLLEVKLPLSYINFLQHYGYWGFEGSEIYGLYNDFIVKNTKDQRKINIDPPFPHSLIPIHALGNGELSCLDTSQMNAECECPVVAWYFGATLPNGKLEILAEDFGAFLLEKVQWGLESLEEDE